MRQYFQETVSVASTLLLVFSLVHIHFSRIGFMVISSPLFTIASFLFLTLGIQKKLKRYFFLLGIFLSLGLYSYNSFLPFPLLIIASMIFLLAFKKIDLQNFTYFILPFILLSFPLVHLILTKPEFYFSHHVHYSPVPLNENLLPWTSKFQQFFYNGLHNLKNYFRGGQLDKIDAFGKYPSIDSICALLSLIGIILFLKKRSIERYCFVFVFLGTLMTVFLYTGHVHRRLLLITPLFYFFIGGVFEFINSRKLIRYCGLVFIGFYAYLNMERYFYEFRRSEFTRFVFCSDLYSSIKKIMEVKGKSISELIQYSDRWSCHYETVRFLMKDYTCIDKSDEFKGQVSTSEVELNDKNALLIMGKYFNSYNFERYENINYEKYQIINYEFSSDPVALIYIRK